MMSAPPRRPLWRRLIPARLRLHGGLIFGSIVVVALVASLLGTVQIRPIVFTKEVLDPPSITYDVRGDADLFDRGVAHDIQIDLSDAEYAKMKADFVSGGDKTWIRADAVIDGTRLESVGVRLKGNSTLMSLRGGRGGPPGMPPMMGPGMPPMPMGSGMPPMPMGSGMPSMPMGPGMPPMPMGPGGGPMGSSVSFDDPSTLPLVISFDHFVGGRGYQGRTELAVRPVMGAHGATLNEAVALQLIAESGQASQRFTWVRFRMNGAPARTRLVIENPDQNYAVSLGRGTGALFKSKATNAFAYKGEDATQYAEDFSQLSAKGSLDLAPVIGLLRFVDRSTDAEFDANIASWIDVDSFALYVATHDLLGNFDDMSGPGRNFLLWYDAGDRRFTVITWDMNLALSGMGARPGAPGGPPREFRGPAPGAMALDGGAPPGLRAPPGGGGSGGGGGPGGGGPGGGGPGHAMRMGNTLKSRFVKSAAMAPLRAEARERLSAMWFTSGRAAQRTRDLASSVPLTESLSKDALDAEVSALELDLQRLGEAARQPPVAGPN